jgi:cation diffusion facilitator CzcD-associated flavoprotein CzcO
MSTHTVLIIGSGFGGMCAAIELQARGIHDYVILERRSFMGGTWMQNTYPGAAVDVQSPLYRLSREPWDWTQMFAERDELAAYTEHLICKHGLRDKTVVDAEVVGLRWHGVEGEWEVETAAKGSFRARFVINASGPLSTPSIPDFEGRDSFRGVSFHTNNWDHDYDYRGRRVAVIGSGASAAQVVPAIAPDVARLHVFQRTPHWVMPRKDRVFSAFERRVLRHPLAAEALRSAIYWGLESRVIGFKYSTWLMNNFARDAAISHLHAQVTDPRLRAALTPDYIIGCKRIIVSNTFYPALTRPNVELHTKDTAVRRIAPEGIETLDGRIIPLDLIVYATGYDAVERAIAYPVVGEAGRTLGEAWKAFPRAYLGTAMPGFPNLFVITGPNTGIGHTSALFIIESQMRYVMRAIEMVRAAGKKAISVRPEAEERYTTMIHREMEKTVWKSGGCKSWYQSKSGHVIAMFPGFSFTFWRLTGQVVEGDHTFA